MYLVRGFIYLLLITRNAVKDNPNLVTFANFDILNISIYKMNIYTNLNPLDPKVGF